MDKISSTSLRIRPIDLGDAQACGRIAFEAHQQVAKLHNFPPEQPNIEFSIGLIGNKLKDPNSYGVIAEQGNAVGCRDDWRCDGGFPLDRGNRCHAVRAALIVG